MLRKSPDLNVWAAISKNTICSRALYKLQNWINFSLFYSKLFSVSIIKKMTFFVNVKPN